METIEALASMNNDLYTLFELLVIRKGEAERPWGYNRRHPWLREVLGKQV